MANDTTAYISIPIIEAMIFRVEQGDSDIEYENVIKAMSSSILNYYFPLVNGFLVVLTSEQNQKQSHDYDYGYSRTLHPSALDLCVLREHFWKKLHLEHGSVT